MHFATHDGREGRAASRLRARVTPSEAGPYLVRTYELCERPDGNGIAVVGEREDDYTIVVDFEEASEALLAFVADHSRKCALLAYRSPLRARGQDDMRSAVVWPAGQWPQIKILM